MQQLTPQYCFKTAKTHYRRARNLVAEMCDVLNTYTAEFDTEDAYCQLDMLVQFVLLKVAMSDGKLSYLEAEFIDKITDTYEVLYLFGDTTDDTNWRWMCLNKSMPHIYLMVDDLEKVISHDLDIFTVLFANVDKLVTSRDFLAELLEELKYVLICFMLLDGKPNKEADWTASHILKNVFIDHWKDVKD